MARNFFENNDDDDDEDLSEEQVANMAHLQFHATELNQHLMDIAARIAEKTWFWRFRTLNNKLTMIASTYFVLKDIVEPNGGEEIEIEGDE